MQELGSRKGYHGLALGGLQNHEVRQSKASQHCKCEAILEYTMWVQVSTRVWQSFNGVLCLQIGAISAEGRAQSASAITVPDL